MSEEGGDDTGQQSQQNEDTQDDGLLGLAPGLGQRVHFEEGLREQLRLKASIEEQDSWTGEEDYRKGR
ncbi:uncharacterized protein LOC125501053 isoform X2 [Athalia rosae]|uniref:uncharacterized protein LOC125501053 isoform X2 n=1 Tax=Athalia rosae TaxID=37344 RepID=UPI0020342CD3|nr:uncharacterized protein LOC125501053 isoform X2 [Athalia rosae]